MRFTYVGRNIEVTEGLKYAVENKMEKFEKYFDADKDIKVVMSTQKNSQTVEVTIFFNDIIFRAEESSSDMYQAIDLIVDKLERMFRKQKTKFQKRGSKYTKFNQACMSSYTEDDNEDDVKIVKRKRINIKPMSEEEAILQLELLNHDFYMFSDEKGAMKLIYKRKDSQYGIIETE